MRIHAVLAVLGALTFGVSTASAATVNFTATYDPDNATIANRGLASDPTQETLFGGFALDGTKPANVGDNFTLEYSFGGAGITGSFIGATIQALTSGPGQDLWISGTLSFLDAVGGTIFSTAVGYDNADPWTSIGSNSIGTNLINTPNFVSFASLPTTIYGIFFSGTIEGALSGSGARDYGTGYIQLFGYDIATVAAVPVPAALPLLAAGLGALGFMGWRKKRAAAPLPI